MTIPKIDFGFVVREPVLRKTSERRRLHSTARPAPAIGKTYRELAEQVIWAGDNRSGLHPNLIAFARNLLAEPPPPDPEPPKPAAPKVRRRASNETAKSYVDGFAPWTDYVIKPSQKLQTVGPTCVVAFSDGEVCRMSTAQPKDKPVNAGRGLRLCVAAWESRVRLPATSWPWFPGCSPEKIYRRVVAKQRAKQRKRPSVTSCHFERGGEIVARFNPTDCNKEIAS